MPWKILDAKIDGMKPSNFMRHLKSIAPNSTSKDFIKYVWLDQLPGQVKTILLACPDKSLEELAKAADRIMEVTESFKQTKFEFVTMQQFEMLSTEVDNLKKAVKELSKANEKQVNRTGGNYKTCSCESQANTSGKEGDDQNCRYESQENNQEELNEKEGDDQNCSDESQENSQEELSEKEEDDQNCSYESQENNQEELSEKEGDDQNCSYESQENNLEELNEKEGDDQNCSYESQENNQEELNDGEGDNQNSSSVSEQSESCDSRVKKLCWYHMCFGKDAHRCVPPCSFKSENK